jgi:prophage DNA circulation protein
MAAEPSNVVGSLAELSFRNLNPVPCGDASYDFGHDQAERRYPFIDAAGHDHTGRQPIKFSATLYFVNTLEAGLYPDAWNEWRDGLFDGSSGKLDHPDLGIVQARVLSVSVKLAATNRAGVIVNVTWTETIDNLDDHAVYQGPAVSLRDAAAAADAACAKFGISYPKIIDPPQISLTDLVGAIEGAVSSTVLQVSGLINQGLGTIRKLTELATFQNTVAAWPVVYNLELLAAGLAETLENMTRSARPTGSTILTTSTTLDAFARDTGNTVVEVANLNPTMLGRPSVPKGASLTFYKAT